jgi:murein L,D-transpeptidase YafK
MHKPAKSAMLVSAALLLLLLEFSPVAAQPLALIDNQTGEMMEGIPAGLILENQHLPYIFWVALQTGQLHLLERTTGGNYLKRVTVSISIGRNGFGKQFEGDEKTPVGVYQITSFLKDDQLSDYYGSGAYPINYPNIWDRLSARTGHGIWLHGLPKGTEKRPPLDSEGCVIIDNQTLKQFSPFIETGESLFVLAESLNWLSPGTVQPSADVLDAIEGWRLDWQNRDNGKYLANYHRDFTDSRRNLEEWKTYKTRVNRSKSYIRVIFSKLSVIAYPGEDNLVAIRFYQQYQSNNFNWNGWKHLLWRRNDSGSWRILYEGNG